MKITNALITKAGEELKKRFTAAEDKNGVITITMKSDKRILEIEPLWCILSYLEPDINYADAFCVYVKLKDGGKVNLPFMNALGFEELVYNILTYEDYDLQFLENQELSIYYKNKSPVPCDVDTVLYNSARKPTPLGVG